VLSVRASVPVAGDYEIWLRGSVRSEVELLVDGDPAATVRHELNNQGQYVLLGEADLAAGEHEIELAFSGADLHPGSGGAAAAIGPLTLSRAGPADARLTRVEPEDARSLCGRAWDWIELDG
jgi:hypothetical protein